MHGECMTELGFSNEGDVLALIGIDVMKLFEVDTYNRACIHTSNTMVVAQR